MSKRIRGKDTIHKSKGRTTGVGVCTFLAHLFEANELKGNKKMTDEEIASRAAKEFPNNKSATNLINKESTLTVNNHRLKYNSGAFTRGIPPKIMSFRYNKRGDKVDGRTGKYPLLPEEIKSAMKKHKEKRDKKVEAIANA